MKALLVVLFACLLSISVQANQPLPNVMQADKPAPSPAATLDSVAWLAGHWRGGAFRGIVEEVRSSTIDLYSFKYVVCCMDRDAALAPAQGS